jgi:hypothetical protein
MPFVSTDRREPINQFVAILMRLVCVVLEHRFRLLTDDSSPFAGSLTVGPKKRREVLPIQARA